MKRKPGDFRRDLLAYIAIAVLIVAIAFAIGWLMAVTGGETNPFLLNWTGLGGVMIVVYGMAIHKYRVKWKNGRFWSIITLAMFLEIGIGTVVLWSAPHISVVVWGLLVYPANFVAVDELLSRSLA